MFAKFKGSMKGYAELVSAPTAEKSTDSTTSYEAFAASDVYKLMATPQTTIVYKLNPTSQLYLIRLRPTEDPTTLYVECLNTENKNSLSEESSSQEKTIPASKIPGKRTISMMWNDYQPISETGDKEKIITDRDILASLASSLNQIIPNALFFASYQARAVIVDRQPVEDWLRHQKRSTGIYGVSR